MKNCRILLLILLGACTARPEPAREYDTTFLNLRGNIKHITEHRATHSAMEDREETLEIEFEGNRISLIERQIRYSTFSRYTFFYEQDKLAYVWYDETSAARETGGRSVVEAKEFELQLFDRMEPYVPYEADSFVRNDRKDPVKIFFLDGAKNILREYSLEYQYDSIGNWTNRKLLAENTLREEVNRNIIYAVTIGENEVTAWHNKADSAFATVRETIQPLLAVDTMVAKDPSHLRSIAAYLKANHEKWQLLQAHCFAQPEEFAKKYGKQNLNPALMHIQKKLKTTELIAANGRSLFRELELVIPMLIDGRRNLKDKVEPFQDRYTLTFTQETITHLRELIKQYEMAQI